MTDAEKLESLRTRLLEEQRRLILAAAEVEALPAAGLLTRTAHLESAIVAVEAMLNEPQSGQE